MKTIAYNTGKEVRVGIIITLFMVAIFATIKVREFQTKDSYMTEETRIDRIEFIHNTIPVLPFADAKLIEEPAPAAATPTMVKAVSTKELAVQLKTWISNKSYWLQEEAENKQELAHQMTTCLKNGSYFSDETFEEEPVENRAALTTQIKLSLASGDYWNEDNK